MKTIGRPGSLVPLEKSWLYPYQDQVNKHVMIAYTALYSSVLHTGLSSEARVMNLRNNSQPEEMDVTEPSAFDKASITAFRFSLSSERVSAEQKNR